MRIWFWQSVVSPHWSDLLAELAELGHEVTLVATQVMTSDRIALGWSRPAVRKAQTIVTDNLETMSRLVASADWETIHICQGLRATDSLGFAQKALRLRGARVLVAMETVEDAGWRGLVRRQVYRREILAASGKISGILCIGYRTRHWLAGLARTDIRLFPFSYFPGIEPCSPLEMNSGTGTFNFIFIGQLVERKRLGLLLEALGRLERQDFRLTVLGSGELEHELHKRANSILGDRVDWVGVVPRELVGKSLAAADCLVLPSRFDGWGAVASEALQSGVPAIVSDSCGIADIVEASGVGGVFRSGDVKALVRLLDRALSSGHQSPERRVALATWAECLRPAAGARYLEGICRHIWFDGPPMEPPWLQCQRLPGLNEPSEPA